MSQMGMQLPGAQRKRAPAINVYTGLMFCAVVALAAAVALMFRASASIGPDEGLMGALKIHPKGPALKLSSPKK
jgi:hypothetical protein